MRVRLTALLALVVLTLTGCGGGGGKITLADNGTTETTAATDDGAGEPDTTEPSADAGSDDGTTGTVDPGGAGMDLDKCLEVGQAFSGIAANAGNMTDAEAQEAIATMKDVLPDELADDIQVMIDAYSADPASAGEALSSQEFIDANTAVTDYLTQICSGG